MKYCSYLWAFPIIVIRYQNLVPPEFIFLLFLSLLTLKQKHHIFILHYAVCLIILFIVYSLSITFTI